MRALVVVWLSGIVVGVVMMERWRRHGGRYVPVESVEVSLDADPMRASASPAGRPNVIGLVVTGAKLDAERVRRRLRPVG